MGKAAGRPAQLDGTYARAEMLTGFARALRPALDAELTQCARLQRMPNLDAAGTPAYRQYEQLAGAIAEGFRLMRPDLIDWHNIMEWAAAIERCGLSVIYVIDHYGEETLRLIGDAGMLEPPALAERRAVEADVLCILTDWMRQLGQSSFEVFANRVRSLRNAGAGVALWTDGAGENNGRHHAAYYPGELQRAG